MLEIIDCFDRLGKAGFEIASLNTRRVAIETRLNNPLLLEQSPPGSDHHEHALQRLQHINEVLHERTWDVISDADAVQERLRRLDDANYRTMLARVGSGWKGEPIWSVVLALPQCQGSPEWNDLVWQERIAADGRPPF